MARIERQEWVSRPVEKPDDWLVLALLRDANPEKDVRVTVEEPFGGCASVGVRFVGERWETGSRALLDLESAARSLASKARPLAATESVTDGERLVEFEFQGEVQRFAVPVR